MANFVYNAVTWQNTITSGVIEAKNIKEAQKIILSKYAYPIQIHQKVPKFLEFLFQEAGTKKMKTEDISGFLLLLGYMLRAGMSITEALTTLARSGDKGTSSLSKALHLRVIEGDDLAQAFTYCTKLVGQDFGSYVRVGVESGNIGLVLINLSEHITREQVTKKKVKSAMSYPLMMICLTLAISIFLFTKTVPQIVDSVLTMMEDGDLPKMTQIVLAISNFLVSEGVKLIIFFLAIGGALFYLLKKPFNYQWHKFQTGVPVLGAIIVNKNMSTFFRSFAIAVGAGMPVPEAMRTAAKGIANKCVQRGMLNATNEVENNGKSLTEVLAECPFVSGIEIPVMDTGVRSSQVQKMSNFVAEIKEVNNDQKIKTFTSLINPIMLAFIGAMVGCIMYAVYGPIFSLMQTMGT